MKLPIRLTVALSLMLLPGLLQLNILCAQVDTVKIDWEKTLMTSKTTPTLQVVTNPMLQRGASIHNASFKALQEIGADYVRFVPWFPYSRMAVMELHPPTKDKTFWDFSEIDPMVDDFMGATKGHSVVMNFSTIPVWMFQTADPVPLMENLDMPHWRYNQGAVLKDTTLKQVADYFERVFSWYTKGGFTDELGQFHKSDHHYHFSYWEVLNEPDLEHHLSPEAYTSIYDAIVLRLKKISPQTKFVGLSLAHETNPAYFEYFLNPANHNPAVPLEGISYHFYARPNFNGQSIGVYNYLFFEQANGFLDRVRYIESIRKRLAPQVFTQINEIGSMTSGHDYESPIPDAYWNLSGAVYAYLYIELTKLGIDVAGESQLVGYPSQFPSVSMINWTNGKPNARFWVLKLIQSNFGPGDRLVSTYRKFPQVAMQAFMTSKGKRLLMVNKSDSSRTIQLPQAATGVEAEMVDVKSGDGPPRKIMLDQPKLVLPPFSVTVISFKN